jgi:dimethylglycine dehydrogenase
VLSKAAPRTDWSQAAFPWLSVREVCIGNAGAVAMSVSFSGELAWELHIRNEQLKLAFSILWDAGQEFGMRPFGLNATESMRIEKGYRHWKADLITEFNPLESALGRFVKLDKDYIGKDALVEMQRSGPRRKFVSLLINTDEAPAHPGNSMVKDDHVIGTITSAAWGYRVGENLAMGFVEPEFSTIGSTFGVEIVGRVFPAEVCAECRYDPGYERVKTGSHTSPP